MRRTPDTHEDAGGNWLYNQALTYPLLTAAEELSIDQSKWRAIKALPVLMVGDARGRPLVRNWVFNLLQNPPKKAWFKANELYNLLSREQKHLARKGEARNALASLHQRLAGPVDHELDSAALEALEFTGPLAAGLAALLLGHDEKTSVKAALKTWQQFWEDTDAAVGDRQLPDKRAGISSALAQYLDARETLVTHNLRLVYSVASKFANRGVPYDDLVQGAMPGLLRAAEKYNHNRGYRFSTYAYSWIRQSIQQQIEDSQGVLRYPSNVHEQLSRLYRERLRHKETTGTEPTLEQLAQKLGVSPIKLERLNQVTNLGVSLESPQGQQAERMPLAETLPQSTFEAVTHNAEIHSLRHCLLERLSLLSATEREVVLLRWGLKDAQPLTRAQTADQLEVSCEWIRQLENSALSKLRWDETLVSAYEDYRPSNH